MTEFAIVPTILPNIHLSRSEDGKRDVVARSGPDFSSRAECRALTEQKLKVKRLSGNCVHRIRDTRSRGVRARARLHGVAFASARCAGEPDALSGSPETIRPIRALVVLGGHRPRDRSESARAELN